jgi:hypothetical protein
MHELSATLISICYIMTEINCHILCILLNTFWISNILNVLHIFIYKLNIAEIYDVLRKTVQKKLRKELMELIQYLLNVQNLNVLISSILMYLDVTPCSLVEVTYVVDGSTAFTFRMETQYMHENCKHRLT